VALLLAAAGCDRDVPAQTEPPDRPTELAAAFDPASCGTLEGQVTWEGEPPGVPSFQIRMLSPVEEYKVLKLYRDNPNAPVIDSRHHGVGSAVVFLRGVDPKRSRPWDLAPVRVEQHDYGFQVHQGDAASHYGFVRRGDAVTMVSTDPFFHSLHAGGASYFTLTFPDPNRPRCRALNRSGIVELSSGAGYYWMRAYLFVDDHPYYARTDAEGRFVLPLVPAGQYEAVCWMPSWHEDRHDREPETGMIFRWVFRAPVESKQPVTINAGKRQTLRFALNTAAFDQ
jgi:hypothetical protein